MQDLMRGQPKMGAEMGYVTISNWSITKWTDEMEEIATTFADTGLTPDILLGAADMFRFIGRTELANLSPEEKDDFPDLNQVITRLAKELD